MDVHTQRAMGTIILALLCFTFGMMYAQWAIGRRMEKLEAECRIIPTENKELPHG